MNHIYFLDLPVVPAELFESLIDVFYRIPMQEQSRRWLHDFQNRELVIAAQEYGNINADLSQDIQQQLRRIYEPFFPNESIEFIVGKFSNTVGLPSVCPPHCDRRRKIAVNYILQTGGPNVRTKFYHEQRSQDDLSAAENRYWKDLTPKGEVVLPPKKWHAYDVQQFHAVENIETDRFLLSIVLSTTNPDIENFLSVYQNLICQTLEI
jgi:hypothetical protein